MITFEDFAKLEIKIGTVISAEKVPDADKLVKFMFDFGTEKRQIMAAIAPFFPDPSILIGKQMPVLINLEPRTFRGYESQGMIIAADEDGKPILLHPEKQIPSGSKVK